MWAGVRANYGVTKGKVAYECKILEHLNVDHLPDEERTRHVVRVGWSTDESSMQLGTLCFFFQALCCESVCVCIKLNEYFTVISIRYFTRIMTMQL